MRVLFLFQLLGCLFIGCTSILASATISGNLRLSDQWEPTVYASRINSLQELFLCSDQLIISAAPIDEFGDFSLEIDLNERAQFIRLHVSKVNGPAATLIIGGSDQNHGFFAVEVGGQYRIESGNSTSGMFEHFASPDLLNRNLDQIERMVREWEQFDRTMKESSARDEARNRLIDRLEEFSDTCSQMLPSLYALYRADMGFNRKELLLKFHELASRSMPHSYLLPYQAPEAKTNLWFLIIGLPLVGYLTYFFVSKILAHRLTQKVDLLSPQEIKVAILLLNGKTNKEIAQTLHVEISTVKSHIYRIFNKLDIDSRKEIRRFVNYFQ